MKRIKSFISLLLTLTMILSMAPMSFAQNNASINIEATAGYYNIEEPMSFYASIPDGYTNISVYGDDKQVDNAVTALADNRCKITIPANTFTKYPYAQIIITADDGNGNTLTAERMINTYLPTESSERLKTDFSNWSVEDGTEYKSDTDGLTTFLRKMGFYDSGIFDATIVRKTAVGGKGTEDVSFALAGPLTDATTANVNLRKGGEKETIYPAILDAEFSLYPNEDETFILVLKEPEADGDRSFSIDVDLTEGVWNRISIQYNFVEDRVVVQVDNGTTLTTKSYDDFELTSVLYTRFRFGATKSETSFIAIDDIEIYSHNSLEQRFELTSPTAGETVTGEFTAVAKAIDAEKVYLYVDGVKNAEQTGIAGEQDYSFTINPANIGYGDKEIRVVAVYADGTMDSGSAVVSVENTVENAVDTGKPTDRIDFNNMADWTDRVITSSDNKTMKNDYTWFVDNGAKFQKVSRVSGPSNSENDYALEVVASDAAKNVTGIRLYFDSSDSNLNMDGTYNLDFDMKVNTSEDGVRIAGPNLWAAAAGYNNTFINNGEIVKTGYTVTPDKWMHYNLRFENNLWYVTIHEYDANGNPVNEQLVVNGKEQVEANTPAKLYFVLMQDAKKDEGEEHAGFAIDNAKVWIEKSGTQIESITYDNAQAASNNTVPCTAQTLTLNLDSAVTSDALTAELYVNSDAVPTDVTINSAAVTVTLPELEANSKLKLVLKDTAGTWADISTFAYVSDENGLYTGCLEYFDEDGQFITHTITSSNTRLSGIVASYVENSMTDVNVYDIFAPAGDSCTMLSAPNSVKTKVMIWDSMDTINPVMKAITLGE